jgi:hypothetical protein
MTSKMDERTTPSGGKWSVMVDKVWFPCLGSSPSILVYSSEQEAQAAFKNLKGLRILLDDSGAEVLVAAGAPWKKCALRMIRQKLKRKHAENLCDMAKFDFSDETAVLSDDFTDSTQVVELPRKRLPSDMMSTDADLESSRTTRSAFSISSHAVDLPRKRLQSDMMSTAADLESSRTTRSAFTMSPVDICQSTSSSVYRLLDLRSRKGSVDICQSTSSSVYRLLDSTSQVSVFIED